VQVVNLSRSGARIDDASCSASCPLSRRSGADPTCSRWRSAGDRGGAAAATTSAPTTGRPSPGRRRSSPPRCPRRPTSLMRRTSCTAVGSATPSRPPTCSGRRPGGETAGRRAARRPARRGLAGHAHAVRRRLVPPDDRGHQVWADAFWRAVQDTEAGDLRDVVDGGSGSRAS